MADVRINIKVHHDGKFKYDTVDGELKYVNSKVEMYNRHDIDYFGWFQLKELTCHLGYYRVMKHVELQFSK